MHGICYSSGFLSGLNKLYHQSNVESEEVAVVSSTNLLENNDIETSVPRNDTIRSSIGTSSKESEWPFSRHIPRAIYMSRRIFCRASWAAENVTETDDVDFRWCGPDNPNVTDVIGCKLKVPHAPDQLEKEAASYLFQIVGARIGLWRRDHAIIVFNHISEAKFAKNALDGFHMPGYSKKMVVHFARDSDLPSARDTKIESSGSSKPLSLCVKHYPSRYTEADIRALFQPYGDLLSVKMVTDKPDDYALVSFELRSQTDCAMRELHGKRMNNGHCLLVRYEDTSRYTKGDYHKNKWNEGSRRWPHNQHGRRNLSRERFGDSVVKKSKSGGSNGGGSKHKSSNFTRKRPHHECSVDIEQNHYEMNHNDDRRRCKRKDNKNPSQVNGGNAVSSNISIVDKPGGASSSDKLERESLQRPNSSSAHCSKMVEVVCKDDTRPVAQNKQHSAGKHETAIDESNVGENIVSGNQIESVQVAVDEKGPNRIINCVSLCECPLNTSPDKNSQRKVSNAGSFQKSPDKDLIQVLKTNECPIANHAKVEPIAGGMNETKKIAKTDSTSADTPPPAVPLKREYKRPKKNVLFTKMNNVLKTRKVELEEGECA